MPRPPPPSPSPVNVTTLEHCIGGTGKEGQAEGAQLQLVRLDTLLTASLSMIALQGLERRDRRKVHPLQTVRMNTLLTTALGLLLEEGISCLPVVDDVSRSCLAPPPLADS